MEKWADYGISEVRYDAGHTLIEKVTAQIDYGESFGLAYEYSKRGIISMIRKGITFVTMLKTDGGDWKQGKPVIIVEIKGTEYIKTEANEREVDDLGDVQEIQP